MLKLESRRGGGGGMRASHLKRAREGEGARAREGGGEGVGTMSTAQLSAQSAETRSSAHKPRERKQTQRSSFSQETSSDSEILWNSSTKHTPNDNRRKIMPGDTGML